MRVVAYLRVSTVNQIDNTSIEMQEDKIKTYCKLHDAELVHIYIDEGLSAKTEDRREYMNMIDFASDKANNIDAILVYKADRIHRSLRNLMNMIDKLQSNNIGFISITEQFDTSNAQGMLFLQMIGSFSEFERKLIAERTKSGRISTANKNMYPGGRVPYGYKLENNKLIIEKHEADIVKDIFKSRISKKNLKDIGLKHGMSRQRVTYILKNKIYLGIYNYDGSVEKNNISHEVESIVTKYTFNKANNIKQRIK